MKKNQKGMSLLSALIVLVIVVAIVLSAIYGYVENIVKLLHISFTGHEGEFIVRVVGVFTGIVGAVAGYF